MYNTCAMITAHTIRGDNTGSKTVSPRKMHVPVNFVNSGTCHRSKLNDPAWIPRPFVILF